MASSGAVLSRLLRRTRISSYDPSVPQVYQTPKAHAVRGDWGVKRPLPSSWQSAPGAPAKARHAGALRYATIAQLDNRDGMTDWKESEREPLFRTRWHEANARLSDQPRRDVLGVSAPGADDVSMRLGPRPRTTYDPATCTDSATLPKHVVWGTHHERFEDVPDVLPNYHAMDAKQFERFLAHLRRDRPKFRAALKAQRAQARVQAQRDQLAQASAERAVSDEEWQQAATPDAAQDVDLWTEARLPHAPQSAADYLQQRALARYDTPASRRITAPAGAKTAHPLRGLQYAQPDSVYTYLLNEPLHGRALHRFDEARRSRYFMGSDAALAVALGGHIGQLPLQHRHGLDTVDYTRADPERGASYFRVLHAWLDTNPPTAPARRTPAGVEDEPELGAVRMQLMALRRPGGRSSSYAAPPLPGSPAWVGAPTAAEAPTAALGASTPEAGSLFGSLARQGRAASMQRQSSKRQRMQKRKRDEPGSTQRDIQMLNNIKNLLSPQ